MRRPREPGFYWVRVAEDEPSVVAWWSAEQGCWLLPGSIEPVAEEALYVLGERLEAPA